MSEPRLHLVKDIADEQISAIGAEMKAKQKALASNGRGARTADVLPPDNSQRYDDLSNAERFLQFVGDDLLYSAEAKKWLIWDGTHWKFDNEDFVFQLAIEFAKNLYSPEHIATDEGRKNARRANNQNGLHAFLGIASRIKTAPIDSLDTEPYLLNCKNGTLDLKTGELRPHSRADRITRLVESDFDPEATSPVFDDFLSTIQPNPDIRAFLQRSIGYSLLGTVRERSFWILYGTGANGKSIFVNLFNNLLGQYASGTTTASIMAGRQSSIPNDIARLRGKRFIVIPETEENERLNSALVKALSAGDQMTARFLFGEYFDFYFTGKLWIATNHKPTITDHSKGFWDRLKLIPFSQNIPPEKVIKSDDLMAQLLADAPAILAWAVQGCRDYLDLNGLDVPDIIQTEIDSYRREQDSIAQFIEECCETIEHARVRRPEDYLVPADYRVSNSDLYRAYKRFCEENGEYLRSHRRLTQNMQERGFRQHNSAGRYWDGIRLLNPL
jgi:putative DNA primase/helicase